VPLNWSIASAVPETQPTISLDGPLPGGRFGAYTVVRPLGKGSQARVYVAEGPHGQVALKVFRGSLDAELRERLRREGEIAARLAHPGFVRLLDAGEVGGLPYLAYELVPTETGFRGRLSALSLRGRVAVIREVAVALGFAHARGIVHRDVKPANLLVDAAGRVRVADLGLALVTGANRLTADGQVVGTPLVMAPEQAAGATVGPAADVWALGLLLYEAATGQRALRSERWLELREELLTGAIRPPREVDPRVPSALEAVILQALERDPARRPPHGAALAAALDRVLAQGVLPDDPRQAPALEAAPAPLESTRAPFPLGPLGRFELLELIGRGGMGVVYRARDPDLDREVALKFILSAQGSSRLGRFQREGEVTASLNHPGILRVHGSGVLEGVPYLVYELVPEARTFDDVVPTLEHRDRIVLLREVAEALGYAHAHGVVHRDVKPENVLVAGDGRALVADFGLAAAEGASRLTKTGTLLGTPYFMAPEAVTGERDLVGPQTDVWALGVMLYQLLTGELPFNEPSFVELSVAIAAANPPRPRSLVPNVDRGLEAVCMKALSQDPKHRYPDGAAMAADLTAVLAGGQPSASQWGLAPILRRARRPLTLLVPLGASALVVLAVASGLGDRDPPTPPPAPPTPPRRPAPSGPSTAWLEAGQDAWREATAPSSTPLARRQAAEAWLEAYAEHPLAGEAQAHVRSLLAAHPRWVLKHADSGEVRARFAPDGSLYSWGVDCQLVRWDAASGRALARWSLGVYRDNNGGDLAILPDGWLAAGATHELIWFNPETQETIRARGVRATTLAVSPDRRVLAAGGPRPNRPVLFDVATRAELRRLERTPKAVKAQAFTWDGRYLYSFSGGKNEIGLVTDCQLAVYRAKDWKRMGTLDLQTQYRFAVPTPDGAGILAGSLSGRLSIFAGIEDPREVALFVGDDVDEGGLLAQERAHGGSMRGAAYTADAELLVTVSQGEVEVRNEIRTWDPRTREEVRPVVRRPYELESVSLAPDDQHFAVASNTGVVEVWALLRD
jgi:serine/threonine protein kinase